MPDEHETSLWDVYQAVQDLKVELVQAIAGLDKRVCLMEEGNPKVEKRVETLEAKERSHALDHAKMIGVSTVIASFVVVLGQVLVAWVNR